MKRTRRQIGLLVVLAFALFIQTGTAMSHVAESPAASNQIALAPQQALVCYSTPLPIPDGDSCSAGATSTIPFAAVNITDVNVRLFIDHPFVDDVTVLLTDPSGGTTEALLAGVGGDSIGFGTTCSGGPTSDRPDFRLSQGGTPLPDTTGGVTTPFTSPPDYAPSVQPALCGGTTGSLDNFNGPHAAGDWTLTVGDLSPVLVDNGTLRCWCLEFTGTTPNAIRLTSFTGRWTLFGR